MIFIPSHEVLQKNGYFINEEIPKILQNTYWRDIIGPNIIKRYEFNLFNDIYYRNICCSSLNGTNRKKLRDEEIIFLHIYYLKQLYDEIELSIKQSTQLDDLNTVLQIFNNKKK